MYTVLKRLFRAFRNKLMRLIKGDYWEAFKNGLQAGRDVGIASNVSFGTEPYLITLGNEVHVSSNVSFITHDGGTWAFRDLEKYKDVKKFGRIKVGDRTIIGWGATIMPGVTIGSRCVIGAHALVTKDIPDGSVAVGVPAKVVMSTMEYAEKCLARMKPFDAEEYKKDKKAYLLKWVD